MRDIAKYNLITFFNRAHRQGFACISIKRNRRPQDSGYSASKYNRLI